MITYRNVASFEQYTSVLPYQHMVYNV